MRSTVLGTVIAAAVAMVACEDKAEVSMQRAKEDVAFLAETAAQDLKEVRAGLPKGAPLFAPLYAEETPPSENLPAVRDALEDNRRQVQDLRVAKSTFFALVQPDGTILRNDQEQDRMAGKNLFTAFPKAKEAVTTKRYLEARGSLKEAAGVREPRRDAQWIAVEPVVAAGTVKGLYVTGWSWTSYAYRLEFALRGRIRSQIMNDEGKGGNEPLVYVFVVVDGDVYAAPVTPDISLEALGKVGLLEKLKGDAPYAQVLEVAGRKYGLAAQRVAQYGEGVAVAVLRSET